MSYTNSTAASKPRLTVCQASHGKSWSISRDGQRVRVSSENGIFPLGASLEGFVSELSEWPALHAAAMAVLGDVL